MIHKDTWNIKWPTTTEMALADWGVELYTWPRPLVDHLLCGAAFGSRSDYGYSMSAKLVDCPTCRVYMDMLIELDLIQE